MQAERTSLRPFERTGNSANIVYYRERGAKPSEAYLWVSVLHSIPFRRGRDGLLRLDPSRPSCFHLTVYRNGKGQIAEQTYTPSGGLSELAPRTVARIVRKALT